MMKKAHGRRWTSEWKIIKKGGKEEKEVDEEMWKKTEEDFKTLKSCLKIPLRDTQPKILSYIFVFIFSFVRDGKKEEEKKKKKRNKSKR